MRGQTMKIEVNGEFCEVELSADATLSSVLRDKLKLKGLKEACGRGECGACTVLLGGRPVPSCLVLAGLVREPVTTIEGLVEELSDLRATFAEYGGFQCGFCTAGQLVQSAAILRKVLPQENDELEKFVRHQLSGNICRCTGYTGIVDAVLKVIKQRRSNGEGRTK